MLLLLLLCLNDAAAQANDGFQRRDGTMYVVRNGEVRAMSHDVHLPNGRLITRDGFVVHRDGRRTELRDNQGCTLLGEIAVVSQRPDGRLQLAGAAPTVRSQTANRPGWKNWPEGRGKGKRKRKKHDD